MKTPIYTRHGFHLDVIRRAVWMYLQFNLSLRDVEKLMIERGVNVSYEPSEDRSTNLEQPIQNGLNPEEKQILYSYPKSTHLYPRYLPSLPRSYLRCLERIPQGLLDLLI